MRWISTRIFLYVLTLSVTLPAFAQAELLQNPPSSRQEFCEQSKLSSIAIQRSENPDNQLAFNNYGGLFNGGVCWWHSLFQRAALYLAVFKPELPKPTAEEVKKIVHSLAAGKKVVEIPGYRNLREFSADWESIIQSKLEEWQLVDGFLKFAWIRGLSGSPSIAPLKLEQKIVALDDLVHGQKDIQWMMLQLDGISSHAALLIDAVNEKPKYSLSVLDSNFAGMTREFDYNSGDRSIFDPLYRRFVPYLGRRSDLVKFKTAISRYCSSRRSAQLFTEVLNEDLNNSFE
jgi:hypothetical protein